MVSGFYLYINMISSNTIYEVDTVLHADSVEWCPINNYQDYLLCGTYQLKSCAIKSDDTDSRIGCLQLYQIDNKSNIEDFKLKQVFQVDVVGVLDMKWCNQPLLENMPTLATADAHGSVKLFSLYIDQHKKAKMKNWCEVLNPNSVALSLDWSSKQCTKDIQIAASYSNGNLGLLKVCESDAVLLQQWNAHGFEAWITAFNSENDSVLYSGGDDCCFRGWDLRCPEHSLFNNRSHDMGVCSIQSCPSNSNLLATGGYDEHVRIWDVRAMRPKPLTNLNVNGGVWRVKWHPKLKDVLAVACMHNGCFILHQDQVSLNLCSRAHYTNHQSLAYGIDWCYLENSVSHFLASCSFYDHKLCLWNLNKQLL
nr:diphthine methyltransferase-like isoform X1 [Ciona intestinalis]|eukprot:XP_026696154.1 diphthine methyltransferase-like isoform X1 [Ciona intestinalis]